MIMHLKTNRKRCGIYHPTRCAAVALFLLLPFATMSVATPKPVSKAQTAAESPLTEVEHKRFDHLQVNPEADLSRYRKVIVEEANVEFDRQWLRTYRREMTTKEEARLKESYGQLLTEALTRKLTETGDFALATIPGEDVLIVKPTLLDLFITAPDLKNRGPRDKSFVDTAGRAKLSLDLVDSVSGEILATLSDRGRAPSAIGNRLEEANRVTNFFKFRTLMNRWGSRLHEYLVSDRGESPA